jgi:hypothetical protein
MMERVTEMKALTMMERASEVKAGKLSVKMIAMVLLLSLLVGCGGGAGGAGTAGADGTGDGIPESGTGLLSLSLTDATTEEYKAVYVTVKEIVVHLGGDGEGRWQVVAAPNKIYNLLELVNGAMEQLSVAELPAGSYTQMRLLIGQDINSVSNNADLNLNGTPHAATTFANYLIKQNDTIAELNIPSGDKTGIKLIHDIDVAAGGMVDLILDFDAAKSVIKRGNSGAYHLKPTIKVIDRQNMATLTGTVTEAGGTASPIAGALVSAQIHNPEAADEKEKVTVFTATPTDDSGNFKLHLEPGDYVIVVTAAGYNAKDAPYAAVLNSEGQRDFSLAAADHSATVSVSIVLDPGEAGVVTISFRQQATTPDTEVEVASLAMDIEGYADPVTFSQALPHGDYKLVASMSDRETKVIDVVVDGKGDVVEIDWSAPATP